MTKDQKSKIGHMFRCKTCKWWGEKVEDFSSANRECRDGEFPGFRLCESPIYCYGTCDDMIEADVVYFYKDLDGYRAGYTSPEFGCVGWEMREEDKE